MQSWSRLPSQLNDLLPSSRPSYIVALSLSEHQAIRKSMAEQKPTLCVIAGPNGSGKTTTTELLLANEWGANSLYINPDNIAEQEFGGWNNPDAILKAAQRATEMRYQCIAEQRDFVFETVFSSAEKLEFLRKAHEEGFFIRLFYVCTKSPEINVSRIAKRYMNGGHEVPISKVVSRYFKSLELAKQAITFVDRAYIYDNSIEDHLPQLLYRTSDGKIVKSYTDDIPEWAHVLV